MALLALALGAMVSSTSANAAGADLVSNAAEDVDLAGSPYLRYSGLFSGDFERPDGTIGAFEVPAELLVPAGRCNEVAIVDVVNSVLFEFPPTDELGHLVLPLGRLLGDDLIAGRGSGEGFTYLAVQWNKLVTDETGSGLIERGTDGWAVLAAAADFLRNTSQVFDGYSDCEITHVLGFGWSQTGKLLAHLLSSGANARSGKPIFDGLFLGVAGGRCRTLTDDDLPWHYYNCGEPPEGHVPTVALNSESEIQLSFGVGALRTPTDPLSVFDYAGIAHIDSQFLPFSIIFADLADALGFAFMQNPVSVVPALRATFWALYRQVANDRAPPASQLLHAEALGGPPVQFLDRRGDASLLTWSGGDVYTADADGDGFADGGIRMPHMPSIVAGGLPAGAPLGVYGGIDFRFAGGPGIFFANGGTFAPFSEAELQALYKNHGQYVLLVSRAANRLVLDGYLLSEDAREMIETAVRSDIGE